MKERFKRYLEQQFRAIRPTLAAAEYREKMLKQLMDRAQELRIKGMDDEDLIYDMCIEELGDFGATLAAFDEQEHKVANAKRNAVLGAVCGVGAALALVIVYLIVSFLVPNSWGLTWLILVGGAFAAVIAVAVVLLVKFGKAKKYVLMRLMPPVVIVLLCVYLFLLLQLVGHIEMSWLVFLAMVVMIAAFALASSFPPGSGIRAGCCAWAAWWRRSRKPSCSSRPATAKRTRKKRSASPRNTPKRTSPTTPPGRTDRQRLAQNTAFIVPKTVDKGILWQLH